jgi:hypothetical protein
LREFIAGSSHRGEDQKSTIVARAHGVNNDSTRSVKPGRAAAAKGHNTSLRPDFPSAKLWLGDEEHEPVAARPEAQIW